RITPTGTPSSVVPSKSARISEGPVVRSVLPASAKSRDGHPHVHRPTTPILEACEEYRWASGLPFAMSQSRRVLSSVVRGRCSGSVKDDIPSEVHQGQGESW